MEVRNRQTLRSLLNERMPRMYTLLRPINREGRIVIPYYGHPENSDFFLLHKDIYLDSFLPVEHRSYPVGREIPFRDLVVIFKSLPKKFQRYTAYTLFHELQIASLGASLALTSRDSNVFEIGCGPGLGSFHYANIVRRLDVSKDKPVHTLTAVDEQDEAVHHARQLKKFLEESARNDYPIAEINFVNADGATYLDGHCKDNDIVFASVAETDVCESVVDFSNSRKISFVLSYVSHHDEVVRRKRGSYLEDLIDSVLYDVYPFQDEEYNRNFRNREDSRIGVLALPKDQ